MELLFLKIIFSCLNVFNIGSIFLIFVYLYNIYRFGVSSIFSAALS